MIVPANGHLFEFKAWGDWRCLTCTRVIPKGYGHPRDVADRCLHPAKTITATTDLASIRSGDHGTIPQSRAYRWWAVVRDRLPHLARRSARADRG